MIESPPPSGSAGPDAARRARLARLLRVVVLLHVAYMLYHWGFERPAGFIGDDFRKHWHAARALLEGASPYIGERLSLEFNHPQAVAFAFVWLGWFPITLAEKIWEWLLIAAIAGCWFIGRRAFRPASAAPPARAALARDWGFLLAFVIASYGPATTSIQAGNIDPLNGLLAVAFVACLLRCRDRRAGVLWVALILCKLIPIALIVPLALWKRWRALAAAAVMLAAYLLLLLLCGRIDDECYFFREVVPQIGWRWRHVSISVGNLALAASGRAAWLDSPAHYHAIMTAWSAAWGTLYILALVCARRRGASLERALEPALLSLPLLSPLLEWHHFVWALPALLLQLRRWLTGGMTPWVAWLNAAGWLVVAFGFQLLDLSGGGSILTHYNQTLAALVLCAVAWVETLTSPHDR